MKWKKFRIKTKTEAEDIIISTLYDIGLEGAQIEDNVPLTPLEKEQMFVDILPQMQEDDGIAYLSFFVEETEDGKLLMNGEVTQEEEILNEVKTELEGLRDFMDIGEGSIAVDETEDIDWINNWKQYFKQFYVDDILIIPSWEEVKEEDKDRMIIHIDPGTAFGTGMHETTQLCIRQLKKFVKEDGEQNREDAADGLAVLPAAQAVPQVVHRASRPLALAVAAAVVDAKYIFGEVGHHPEKGRDPHPEHRAGAADDDGRRHAGDVAGADGGGKGGTQRLELGNGLLIRFRVNAAVPAEHAADGLLPPMLQVGDLEPLCAAGHQNARADEQNQADLHPDKGVDLVIDPGKCREKILHTYPLFPVLRGLRKANKK